MIARTITKPASTRRPPIDDLAGNGREDGAPDITESGRRLSAPTIGFPGVQKLVALDLIITGDTNPRQTFDTAEDDELVASIERHGIIEPLVVRSVRLVDQVKGGAHEGKQYELIAGERRYRAARRAGHTQAPVIIRDVSDIDALELQMIENLQRKDLTPLEEANGYHRLHAPPHNLTADQIAGRVCKSRAHVYDRLKLLSLAPETRDALVTGKIAPSTALELARVPAGKQQQVIDTATEEKSFLRDEWRIAQKVGSHLWQIKKGPTWTVEHEVNTLKEAAHWLNDNYDVDLGTIPVTQAGTWRSLLEHITGKAKPVVSLSEAKTIVRQTRPGKTDRPLPKTPIEAIVAAVEDRQIEEDNFWLVLATGLASRLETLLPPICKRRGWDPDDVEHIIESLSTLRLRALCIELLLMADGRKETTEGSLVRMFGTACNIDLAVFARKTKKQKGRR